jgi:hypothetical protein
MAIPIVKMGSTESSKLSIISEILSNLRRKRIVNIMMRNYRIALIKNILNPGESGKIQHISFCKIL